MSSVFHQRVQERQKEEEKKSRFHERVTKRKPSVLERLAAQAPAEFFSEAVGQIPSLAVLAEQTTPYVEAVEEIGRPSFLSSTGLEPAPEKGLRNLLALLGKSEKVQQLTPERLRERFKETTEGEFEPQSELERIILRPFRLGGGIAGLGGGFKAALSAIPGAVIGQTLREAGLPEAAASTAEVLGPLLQLPKKGLQPTTAEEKLVQFGKGKGLTERELAPLLKKPDTQKKLGSLALKTKELKTTTQNLARKFEENFYEPLKESAEGFGRLNETQTDKLLNNLADAYKDLSRSRLPTTDKQYALDQLLKLVEDIEQRGISPRDIIDTWQDINKSIEWKKAGQKPFTIVKEALAESFESVNPELAEEFRLTNQLYSRFKPFEKAIQPNVIDEILALGPSGELALAMAFHNPSILRKALGAVGGKFVAKELLTNPRYHNFIRKFQSAVARQDRTAIAKLNEQFRQMYEKDIAKEKQ